MRQKEQPFLYGKEVLGQESTHPVMEPKEKQENLINHRKLGRDFLEENENESQNNDMHHTNYENCPRSNISNSHSTFIIPS